VDAKNVILTFYDAFARRDGGEMSSLYADHVEFQDPVFPALRGDEARSMWKMLCERASDLNIEYQVTGSTGDTFFVRWVADYTFTATGRKVRNEVHATLTVHNGQIIMHHDRFNFWKWSAQALGPAGMLLGWSPGLRKKVQSQARANLNKYMSRI
jgi:ketosteroid isomerase-like protein